MDQRKLFQVLVIGGALLGLGCEERAAPRAEDAGELVDGAPPAPGDAGGGAADAAALADAAPVDAAPGTADAAALADAGGELESCGFCPNDCCVDDGMGGSKARDGFECCWGTSC